MVIFKAYLYNLCIGLSPAFREGIKFPQIPYGLKRLSCFFHSSEIPNGNSRKIYVFHLHILTSSRSLTSLLSRLSALQFKMAEENFDGMYGMSPCFCRCKGHSLTIDARSRTMVSLHLLAHSPEIR